MNEISIDFEFEYFDNGFCLPNVCSCENGTVNTECEVHDTENCASCYGNYYNDGTTCSQRQGVSILKFQVLKKYFHFSL